jgi:chemotaxis protein CheD
MGPAITGEHHYLMPAELMVADRPGFITTVLGSCVAICLWDESIKLAGINHYMLPLWNGYGLETPKYGNIAIEKLIEKMLAKGSSPNKMIAKVFGGAEVLNLKEHTFDISERNILIAKELLGQKKIALVASSIGGKHGRKIIFDTATGKVYQKFINKKSQSS